MKIKQEHFDHLKKVIDAFLATRPLAVQQYEEGNFVRSDRTRDLQMRFCFDVLHAAGLTPWVCKELYPYMNDDHLYTALKRICPKVERKY